MQILLRRHILIHADQNGKARVLRCGEQVAVGQAGETSVPASLALVAGEVMPQTFVYALVEEQAHSAACEQRFSGLFQGL